MDAFIFVMGLTLAAVGVFLFRDYVRFLAGSYSISGKVVSIQQVFIPKPIGRKVDIEPYVADGFYPVVEYKSDSTPIRFTAIDNVASGRFHVGDKLRLKVTKSRRKHQRHCRSMSILMSLLVLLASLMFVSATMTGYHLSVIKIISASFVLAIGFAMLIIYTREQDEQSEQNQLDTGKAYSQLCLFEPTAFNKWQATWQDRRQLKKIRGARAAAGFCFTSASMLVLAALMPVLSLSVQ